MRVVDTDDSGTIEFSEFADLMLRWQDGELRDVFHFFDQDHSGSINVHELSRAIRALGENGGTQEEADRLASYVDSDKSGLIDIDEFTVFMKPRMSVAQTYHAEVRTDGGATVRLTISALGMDITDKDADSPSGRGEKRRAYSFFMIEKVEETAVGFAVTAHHRGATTVVAFETAEASGKHLCLFRLCVCLHLIFVCFRSPKHWTRQSTEHWLFRVDDVAQSSSH